MVSADSAGHECTSLLHEAVSKPQQKKGNSSINLIITTDAHQH